MLEMQHIDYGGNNAIHFVYLSPYNQYDPEQTSGVYRMSFMPGTTHFGTEISYWNAPFEMDLSIEHRIIIELPTSPTRAITPYASTDDGFASGLIDWKIQELNDNSFFGDMVLGSCFPDMSGYYDEVNKIITLEGPIDFPSNPNLLYPNLLYTGVPQFIFRVV